MLPDFFNEQLRGIGVFCVFGMVIGVDIGWFLDEL
jgi:hypothetical protein